MAKNGKNRLVIFTIFRLRRTDVNFIAIASARLLRT